MKENNKYYTILVGGKMASDVEFGFLDKKSGQPTGERTTGKIRLGLISIPNYSKVWGRLIEKNNKLTGDIEFLEWGAEGGGVVEIRYLPNSKSLSKLYQDTIVKLVPRDEDADINLQQGLNNFDLVTDAVKIEMLKHHSLNGSNKSRDPKHENTTALFSEYNKKDIIHKRALALEMRRNVEGIVLGAKDDAGKLAVLAAMFDIDSKEQDDVIFGELLEIAEKKTELFNTVIEDQKQTAQAILNKAKEYKILDLKTIPSEIMVNTVGGKEKLFHGIEDGVKDKLLWVVLNITQPDVFDGINKLKGHVDEYEQKNLN